MSNMGRFLKRNILIVMVTVIMFGGLGVLAASTIFSSKNIKYNGSSNVQVAIDDLFEKVKSCDVNEADIKRVEQVANALSSSKISYDNSKGNTSATTLNAALDELYAKLKTCKLYKSYAIGDRININDELYYVIADSGVGQDYVTLLKANPLTVDEVNEYGDGKINLYPQSWHNVTPGNAGNQNGYGSMLYYNSETCGDMYSNTGGCTNEYELSDIKHVIDQWESDKFDSIELKEIKGYTSRLLDENDLVNNLKCDSFDCSNSLYNWLYDSKYGYWTMIPYTNSKVYWVGSSGSTGHNYPVGYVLQTVRPVINVYKSSLKKDNKSE